MKNLFFILISVFTFSGLSAQEQVEGSVIEPAEYWEQIQQKDVQLIDVRTPEEFAEGHIEGAENINFHSDDFLDRFERFDKEQPVYIYCRSGNRSSKASKKLIKAGFEKVIDLNGGYLSWEEFFDK